MWVFGQDALWIDYWGNEIAIESMPVAYVANVLSFCHRQAERIHSLVAFDLVTDELTRLLAGARPDASVLREAEAALAVDPAAWLEETPLLQALRRRLEMRP